MVRHSRVVHRVVGCGGHKSSSNVDRANYVLKSNLQSREEGNGGFVRRLVAEFPEEIFTL